MINIIKRQTFYSLHMNSIITKSRCLLRFDGCSKGNPGKSGAGAALYSDNVEIWADYLYVGSNITNNQAEYAGLILGLNKALELNITDLDVEGDSKLVIQQMNKTYKCNSQKLQTSFKIASDLSSQFNTITFRHIYRDDNKRADKLANMAIVE